MSRPTARMKEKVVDVQLLLTDITKSFDRHVSLQWLLGYKRKGLRT